MGRHSFQLLLCAIAVSAVTGCGGFGPSVAAYSHASILSALSLPAGYQGSAIAVQGSLAYVSTMANGGQSGARSLVIINLESPAAPTILSATSSGLSSDMAGIAVSGKYAYVTYESASGTNFQVWDVSNPTSPSVAGSTSIPCPTGMVPFRSPALVSNYAYVACWESEVTTTGAFAILDVSNPASPSAIGSVSVIAHYQPVSLVTSGQNLYVVATQGGSTGDYVLLYSIQNPVSPSLQATAPTAHSPQWVAAQGTMAVVAIYDAEELQVADFSHPSSPQTHTVNLAPCRPMSVTVYQGSVAFAPCDSPGGVAEVDLAAAGSPSYVGTVLSGTVLNLVAGSGSYLYGVDTSGNFDTIGF